MSVRNKKTGILASLVRGGFDKSRIEVRERGVTVGCSQCDAVSICGIACHENGCPNRPRRCAECGDSVPRGEMCSCEMVVVDVEEEG
jgi:hypothetical protein